MTPGVAVLGEVVVLVALDSSVGGGPDLLRLLAIRLKANSYDVHAVDSGQRALAAIGASRPDLVLTDLRMDGMDGMALFQEIQAAQKLVESFSPFGRFGFGDLNEVMDNFFGE